MSAPADFRRSPICADLRSKRYFFLQAPPMESSDVLDASNDCWCERSHDRVGPDKDLVHPDDCRAGRACFRSLYETPAPRAVEEPTP
jgi:hypothetical protein